MWFAKKTQHNSSSDTPPTEAANDTARDNTALTGTTGSATLHEAFSLEGNEVPPPGTILFSDKKPEELEEEILTEQANMRNIREATEALILEEHPEVERRDTIEKAHERGEI